MCRYLHRFEKIKARKKRYLFIDMHYIFESWLIEIGAIRAYWCQHITTTKLSNVPHPQSVVFFSVCSTALFLLSCSWAVAGVCAVHSPVWMQSNPEDFGALHPGADAAHPGRAASALWAAGPGEHTWLQSCSFAHVLFAVVLVLHVSSMLKHFIFVASHCACVAVFC